jgi:alpha-galactosidase
MYKQIVSIVILILISINVFAQKSANLAPTPPMGWNSWNWFGKKEINETIVKEVIDAMVESGLKDAGYNYLVIDGGWRDNVLAPNGELLSHPVKFPNGIKPLAQYAHSKGLKIGVHTVPGTHDCIYDPVGGYGKEEVHIAQFVDWGIDFIKLDLCRFNGGWDEKVIKETYFKWRKLMDEKSSEPILLSISAYEWRDWYTEIGQMARTTNDIAAKVAGMSGTDAVFDGTIPKESNKWGTITMMKVADENNKWADKAGNGYWNDPDMMVIGDHGLTEIEQQTHFALWCVMSSPLFLGNDPRNMSPFEIELLTNKDAIAVNQDPTEQGKRIKQDGDAEVWVKNLKNGDLAILLLNRGEQTMNVSVNLSELGIIGEVTIKDIYERGVQRCTEKIIEKQLESHACNFLIINR